MRNEDRKVQVMGKDGAPNEEFEYTATFPENIAEAIEVFGEGGVMDIFLAGLTVKKDNAARNKFKTLGDTEEGRKEAEEAAEGWRPGGNKTSKASVAMDLIMEYGAVIAADPDLRTKIKEAHQKKDWDTIISECKALQI